MKKTITLKVKQVVEKQFEVDFPIFSEHPTDHCTYYRRLEEDGRNWEIVKWHGRGESRYEIEFRKNYSFDTSDPDYHLGRGMYSLSREEFDAVLKELREAVSAIGDPASSGRES